MDRRKYFFPTFLIFIFFCLVLFFVGKTPVGFFLNSTISNIFAPVQKTFFNLTQNIGGMGNNKLNQENIELTKKLVDQKRLETENLALHDQFQTTTLKSSDLLPAQIIGAPSFIPNMTIPEELILNKGSNDGVKKGQAVVYMNNLVGEINQVQSDRSSVELIGSSILTFAAKSLHNNVIGVIRGKSQGEMIFDNVLLSDKIVIGDMIVTKGDQDLQGNGLLPDLIVGKIIGVDKNPSSLFQNGNVKSLLDLNKLTMVFVVIK